MTEILLKRLEASDKFCSQIGLHETFLRELYNEKNDWSFIIKSDALHETACRALLRKTLFFESANMGIKKGNFEKFIKNLSFNGKSSVLSLLQEAGCPSDHCRFVECVRKIRNSYAHDITKADSSLIDMILNRKDKSHILQTVACLEEDAYDEKVFLDLISSENNMLKFSIWSETLRFLNLIYLVLLQPEKLEELKSPDTIMLP